MTDLAVKPAVRRAHPDTSTIFVLGLIGLPGSLIFAVCAWYFGNRLLAKYDAEPERWGRRNLAVAGRTMGMIGTAMSALWVVVLIVVSVLNA